VSDTEVFHFSGSGLTSITDLQVSLTIANGYNGVFCACLVHASGFSLLLNRAGRTANNPSGYSDAGMSVTLSAAALTFITIKHIPPFIEAAC
jgi:hypothetical protein